MSRKKKAPKKIPIVDPKFKSTIIPKLINSIMYDGKKTIAEKIVYEALEKIKSKRSQALALRWLIDASRKRKDKKMSDKIFNEIYDAYNSRGAAIKKKEDTHKMAESNKAFAHFRW